MDGVDPHYRPDPDYDRLPTAVVAHDHTLDGRGSLDCLDVAVHLRADHGFDLRPLRASRVLLARLHAQDHARANNA